MKNLDQAKAGDKVHFKYYRAVLQKAEILGEDTKRGGTVTDSAVATAAVGEMPAGIAGREVRVVFREALAIHVQPEELHLRSLTVKRRISAITVGDV